MSPEYPDFGAPCNGCGVCCQQVACQLAEEYMGVTEGPCPALEWGDDRYWCGLVRHPSRYIDLGAEAEWKDAMMGHGFALMLGVGMGCDSELDRDGAEK